MNPSENPTLSFVIPCLNEEQCLGQVLDEARLLNPFEIIVVDNNSQDRSVDIAHEKGARVLSEKQPGYGRTLLTGIQNARADLVVFFDADGSYPLGEINRLVTHLQLNQLDMVLANRLTLPSEKKAMPFLNKYLGTPVLSFLIRTLYKVPIYDCNSGMRVFRRDKFLALDVQSPGMEFASEMLVKAALANWKIAEVPVRFRKDQRQRPPHLKRWQDGLRHLRLILSFVNLRK